MGTYIGYACRLHVKKDAPKEVIALLNYLFDPHTEEVPEEAFKVDKDLRYELCTLLHGESLYFPSWDWVHVEEASEYIVYETRSSSKGGDAMKMLHFLKLIQGSLVVKEGDILFRELVEDGPNEHVIAVIDGHLTTSPGFKFKGSWEYITDSRHPQRITRMSEGTDPRVHDKLNFSVPWTIQGCRKLNEHEKKDREMTKSNHWGF